LRFKKEGWIWLRWSESDEGLRRFNCRGLVLESRAPLNPSSRQFNSKIIRPSVLLPLTPVLAVVAIFFAVVVVVVVVVVWWLTKRKVGPLAVRITSL